MRVSPHSALGSGHLCPELASLEWFQFSVVSAEFQTGHWVSFHMRFNNMALSHQVCFVRIRVHISKSSLLLLHDTFARTCSATLHVASVLTHVWMPMPSNIDCRHGSLIVTSYPSSFKRCLVTIHSAVPVVKAYSSASAELKLTDCCVRRHAERVSFLHRTTSPLVLS